jgi:ribosomal protein L11 methyltransferase
MKEKELTPMMKQFFTLKAQHPEYAPLLMTMDRVADADWENNWKQFYKPMEIGQRLIVVPEWEKANTHGRIPLILNPGLTFGTGSHATTRLCLTALEKHVRGGEKVLDLGCGSGILGIGALLLGSDSCLGVDIDPKAPDVVMANAALNEIGPDRMTAWAGDIIGDASLRARIGGGYQLVLANIVADVIIPLSAVAPDYLKQGGIFITSGIAADRVDDVKAAMDRAGLKVLETELMGEWAAVVAER